MTNTTTTTTAATLDLNTAIFDLYPVISKSIAIKYGCDDMAHDLTMATLVKAIEKQDTFNPELSKLRTWVSRIAMTTVLDYLRSHAVSKTAGGYTSVELDAFAGGYDVDFNGVSIDATDFWATVGTIVNAKEHGVLFRRFGHDMSYAEIAEDMGIPKGSVMSSISNGKKKLKNSSTFTNMFGHIALPTDVFSFTNIFGQVAIPANRL